MKKTIALLYISIALASCTSKVENTQSNTTTTDTILVTTTANELTESNEEAYQNTSYPTDSLLTTKVLMVGTFHGDEVDENAAKQKWFGVFKNKTDCYLAETSLLTKRVFDAIVDENENSKTGWQVETTNKDTAILLIEKLNYLSPHNFKAAELQKNTIYPGESIEINYLGNTYKLFATGTKNKIEGSEDSFTVEDYQLIVSVEINGVSKKNILVAEKSFDDKMTQILFAGDIDGDGILDLIIDTSNHYNASMPTLYLSKAASKNEVVKPVARHTSVGC